MCSLLHQQADFRTAEDDALRAPGRSKALRRSLVEPAGGRVFDHAEACLLIEDLIDELDGPPQRDQDLQPLSSRRPR